MTWSASRRWRTSGLVGKTGLLGGPRRIGGTKGRFDLHWLHAAVRRLGLLEIFDRSVEDSLIIILVD